MTNSKTKKSKYSDKDIYDCIVIGTGTSSEPVLYHLSKTKLKTLVIDRSNIYKEYKSVDRGKKGYISNLTPKQIFSDLKIHHKKDEIYLTPNLILKCIRFSYIFSYVSGGLSNFWGGGLFNWPDSEIKKTTSLPCKLIKKSYKNIFKRLKILNRDQFLQQSFFAKSFLSKNNKNIFQPSKFFISNEGISNHQNKREHYDQNIIWKSSHTIRKYLEESENLEYRPNVTALSIEKKEICNLVYCCQNDINMTIKTKAIFLCSGVLNSTYLAFSALNMRETSLTLNHGFAAIVPILYCGFLPRFNKNNIELPDLSWSLLSKKINISGYLISSRFINKKLTLKFKNYFLKGINKIVEKIISSVAFITVFTNSNQSKTILNIKRIYGQKNQKDKYLVEIKNDNTEKAKRKFISSEFKKINKFIKGRFFLLNFLIQYAKTGGDIHYGSTMPDEKIMASSINTTSIGELNNLKNVFVCDPSRMGYISSLPHTYTSMAIVDASMPIIIKKLI